MSVEKNKETIKRVFEEAWNKGNVAIFDETHTPTTVAHFLPPGLPPGVEGVKQFVKLYRTAFPDLKFVIDDVIAEGDLVALRWTATGTHKGQFMNFPPTFKKGTTTGITIARYDKNGKGVEVWSEFDQLGMLQQLGLIPMPA